MKKLILLVIYIIFSLLASGCNSVPFTYDALEAEAARTGDRTRLERFERMAVNAELFYMNRGACMKHNQLMWVCYGREKYDDRRPPKGVDGLVHAYMEDKHNCNCYSNRSLDDLF